MASYGSFETNREIASGQGAVVYNAHKAGESANTYAVKVFSLESYVGGDQESREGLAALLEDLNRSFAERVALQKIAAESSKHVAPIFDSGSDGNSAWYVTRLYPRSIHKIIEGRVTLGYEGFYHIIRSMLDGALDLKRICGRSHGNLKSTNVLIGGAKIQQAEVVVSDPLPGGAAEVQRYEVADLRSIGEIIYQLVRQRELTDASDWLILPIESSSEWTNLFENHSATWLTLCNRLLDPNLSIQDYSLEKLKADLEVLRPKPAVSGRILVVAAVAIVLAGIGVFFASNRPTRVIIESRPAPAIILGTGQSTSMKTSPGKPVKIKMAPGAHELTAHVEGLVDVVKKFYLAKGETKTIQFDFDYGTVHLESQPPNASVLADGKEVGKTPLTIFQKPGSVTYQLDLGKNFETARLTASVKPNEEVKLNSVLKPLSVQGEAAIVEFSSDPDGAKLILNGKESDEMPARKLVPSGTNQVTAQFRDWPPLTATLILTPGQKTNFTFNFEYARVALRSEPPGATVWAGKNRFGPTPAEMLAPVGPATFKFERAGFEGTNVTVNIAKGGKFTVNAKLVTTNAILEFTSDLAPALITVAGPNTQQQIGYTSANGPLVTNLAPGTYSATAHFGDLEDKVITKQALKGTATPFAFAFAYGTANLDSQPPDATITSGTKSVGVVPQRVYQRPGVSYTYKFTAPGYEPFETNVVAGEKGLANITVKLLPAAMSVTLSSDPPAAIIFEDRNNLGAVEQIQKLAWGDHKLVARYPGLDPVTEVLTVSKTGTTPPHIFRFSYGTASITSAPPGALIKDHATGNQLGITPTNLFLRPGKISYDLIMDDKVSNIVAVIQTGLNPLGIAFSGKTFASTTGMQLVWVDKLPGTKEGGYVGKYEVTQAEYEKVMGANPSQFAGDPRRPVENVSWTVATEFCRKLTELDKAKFSNLTGGSAMHYVLPTEVQWGFFAEGVRVDSAVVKKTNPGDMTAPVGSTKVANKYGLYDVLGNVWEWCDSPDAEKPMRGWAFNSTGGFSKPFDLEKSYKNDPVAMKRSDIGFRVILIP
ncbi:MAG: serine/threonine-protein kinase pkn1 [Pedosphaera sp.]|nr:serine/threonine-protein kinase pkn1 [Pedosphaera sp.]